jgi:hypothetical protein
METLPQILQRKALIEEELQACLDEAQADFTIEDVKKVIYDTDNYLLYDFDEVIDKFEASPSYVPAGQICSALSEAWNYFPHRDLCDLSPAEYWSSSELRERFKESEIYW